MGRKITNIEENFWSRVDDSTGIEECWNWLGYIKPNGYGSHPINRAKRYAHRLSYEFVYGAIGKGLEVCHSCDNKKCVNPRHLWLGTQQDNMDDKVAKGRQHKGQEIKNSKLTEKMVSEMRELYLSGLYTHSDLAAIYGCTRGNVLDIMKNRHWKTSDPRYAQWPNLDFRSPATKAAAFIELKKELGKQQVA